jgi:death-on-curing protein
MAIEDLADAIRSLRPDDQESVRQFVEFLKRRGQSPPSSFLTAVDEFIDQHDEVTAVRAECLSQNHPFVDGNKRVAVTVTAAFLKVNGFRLTFDDADAFLFLSGLYESGRMRFVELETWLRQHTMEG